MFIFPPQTIRVQYIVLLCILFISGIAHASPPKLNFSDLISGPATGLNDSQGSGVIITVWGQHLGNAQNISTVTFTDSEDVVHSGAHVYYWKNADGELPGGPSNLKESHGMQEFAFSIPASANSGPGEIQVAVDGKKSNALPFTIRAGAIYHVMNSGDDSSGTGSFSSPWKSIDNALNEIDAPGATIYVHDSISTGQPSDVRGVYWNDTLASSSLSNQFGIVAYPNSQPIVIGRSGFRNYRTEGQVISKISIFASDCDEDANGQPTNCATNPVNQSYGIQTSAWGRAVGNAITDRAGGCADGTQAAISGNALSGDRISGYQILGNEVYEYGCPGTSKLHHTTYLSVRSGEKNLQVDPWRFGWNYLHDNHTKNGIHQYDENNSGFECGSPNDTVIINDNVVVNQAGAGINIGTNCPWTNDFEVYNNVIINAGLALDWDGVDPDSSNGPNTSAITIMDGDLMGRVNVYNNTFHTWNDDNAARDTQACLGLQGTGDNTSIAWNNNLCYSDNDKPFINHSYSGPHLLDNISGSNNVWFYSGSTAMNAIPPSWDAGALTSDPLLTTSASILYVDRTSPIVKSTSRMTTHDVYGTPRAQISSPGAAEYAFPPPNPPTIQLID